MDKHTQFEYSQITEFIYIGTNQCCQIHFDQKLLDMGIKADISLEAERIDTPNGVDFYLWLPTIDETAPSQDKLEIGANFIDQLVQKEVKVYIHCMNGHGRAPTLTASYLIMKGNEVDEAISIVKDKRPEIHLNEEQYQSLMKFKENLMRGGES